MHQTVKPLHSHCNALTFFALIGKKCVSVPLNSIYLLQKRFVRTATFSRRLDHSAPLFKQLKILSVFQINTFQICTFVFKFKHTPDHIPIGFHSYFQLNSEIHNYNTRQASSLHPPLYSTTQGQFSIKYRGTILWDQYSTGPQPISLVCYKNTLKAILIDQLT